MSTRAQIGFYASEVYAVSGSGSDLLPFCLTATVPLTPHAAAHRLPALTTAR